MTIETTLNERGARYGDFAHHAKIAQDLQDVARGTAGWERLDAAQRQALTVICDKIARILSGDPNYSDNWHDIQGYAKLVEDRLPKVQKANPLLNLPVVEMPSSQKYVDAVNINGPKICSMTAAEAAAAAQRKNEEAMTVARFNKMHGVPGASDRARQPAPPAFTASYFGDGGAPVPIPDHVQKAMGAAGWTV